jgi:hypothetical protein
MRPRRAAADRQARSGAGPRAIALLHPVEFVSLVQFFRRGEFSADPTAGLGNAIFTPRSWVKLRSGQSRSCACSTNTTVMTMRHGRRLGCVALLVLCGFLSAPSRVAAQQFPPFPEPAIDNSFNGGSVRGWWRRPSGREATPRDIRPVVRKAANVTNEPIAKPAARLKKSAATSVNRQQAAQPARPNAAAWWKRLKMIPSCAGSVTASSLHCERD